MEDVAPNGAAAQGGVLAGDILHALTVVMDRRDQQPGHAYGM